MILYTMVVDDADWDALMGARDLSRWYLDDSLTQRAAPEVADIAGDDVYTEWGWNVRPREYPVLAHIEVC